MKLKPRRARTVVICAAQMLRRAYEEILNNLDSNSQQYDVTHTEQ